MVRGVYIVANQKVGDNAIALLSSLRRYDAEVPVYMIPFNDDYQTLLTKLETLYQVQLFPDLDFLETFTQKISDIFPRDFLALPNKMRKLAAWFGPLDDFTISTPIFFFFNRFLIPWPISTRPTLFAVITTLRGGNCGMFFLRMPLIGVFFLSMWSILSLTAGCGVQKKARSPWIICMPGWENVQKTEITLIFLGEPRISPL